MLLRSTPLPPNAKDALLTHKFAVGQTVYFTPATRGAVAGEYEIRHLMPSSNYQIEPHYRIKSAIEQYDRVVMQSHLSRPHESATAAR